MTDLDSILQIISQQGEEIKSLQSQVAELKGFRVVQSGPRKPVNAAAWRKAMDARIYGKDRGKAEREYEKIYRIPEITTQTQCGQGAPGRGSAPSSSRVVGR